MVVGTRSKTRGQEVWCGPRERDRELHQTEEENKTEESDEVPDDSQNRVWGVRVKQEIIRESIEEQEEYNNKRKDQGTEVDPIKITDKDWTEIIENERKEKEKPKGTKVGNYHESKKINSTSSKRRLQGDKPSKRSKKYYKDIREFAKLFQTKNREDTEKNVIPGSTGRETEEYTSEIKTKTHNEEEIEEKNNERTVFQQRKEKGTTSNYQEQEESTDEDVDTYIKKGQETIMGME